MRYPRVFSHVGISVPDLDKAIKFYREVMGWYLIISPFTVVNDDSIVGIMCKEAFGGNWTQFRAAHLSTSDGIGFEIFQWENNEPSEGFNYWKTGLAHFSVQDPDIEGLVKKIVDYGGKQRMPIRYCQGDKKPYKMCYVEDPFGIVFEIYTHSFELTHSWMAYTE